MSGKKIEPTLIPVILLLLAVTSCVRESRIEYNVFRGVSTSGWLRDAPVAFSTDRALDTLRAGHYDVSLTVRALETYPYEDLWLRVEDASLRGESGADTIRIPLTDGAGNWTGKARRGVVETTCVLHADTVLYPGYEMEIRHVMQCDTLPGLLNIGLKIERK